MTPLPWLSAIRQRLEAGQHIADEDIRTLLALVEAGERLAKAVQTLEDGVFDYAHRQQHRQAVATTLTAYRAAQEGR